MSDSLAQRYNKYVNELFVREDETAAIRARANGRARTAADQPGAE